MIINKYSTVYLMEDYPLTKNDLGTLTFSDKNAQYNYFISKMKSSHTGLSYIKDNKNIRLNVPYSDVMNINYLFFKNTQYSDKWIYCFVNDVEYVNDNSVNISYEIDDWQTYLFDKDISSCFVEREHVNDDSIGGHTVAENLETGEFVIGRTVEFKDYVGVTVWGGQTLADEQPINEYGNVYSNLTCCSALLGDTAYLDSWIKATPIELLSHAVVTPQNMINSYTNKVHEYQQNVTVLLPNDLDGYNPRNNKLFTFPYMYCVVDNYLGESVPYHIENFYQGGLEGVSFNIYGTPYPKPTLMIRPINYKKGSNTTEEGLIYDTFPLCSLAVDSYNQWIATNGWSNALGIAGSGALAVGSIATGNVIGAIGGIGGVVASVSERVAHEKFGKSLKGGVGNGSINCAENNIGFRVRIYTIKQEYAKIIDNYFSRYGYQVNSYKVPNTHNRSIVNFVKTNGACVKGKIPTRTKKFMEECLNNGMSFWHNPERVGENN